MMMMICMFCDILFVRTVGEDDVYVLCQSVCESL